MIRSFDVCVHRVRLLCAPPVCASCVRLPWRPGRAHPARENAGRAAPGQRVIRFVQALIVTGNRLHDPRVINDGARHTEQIEGVCQTEGYNG